MQLLEPVTRRLGRRARRRRGPILFSFNGGAGGFKGMGADLFESEPAFREAIERACAIVREESGYDALRAFTEREEAATKVEDLVLLGLIHLAQVELWRSAGVEPDAVLALSLGEAGAAYAAGGLGFEDAVRVVCAIGEGSRDDRRPHALLTVALPYDEATALCERAPVRMAVAGTLDLEACTLLAPDGDRDAARAHVDPHLIHEGFSARATHTPLADSVRPKFLRLLAKIEPRPLDRPCFLASAGRDVSSDGLLDARHWAWLHDHGFLYGQAADAALSLDPALVVQIGVVPHTKKFLEAAARRQDCRAPMLDTMQAGASAVATWSHARDFARQIPGAPVPRREVHPRTLDLNDPEIARNPWPVLAELRRRGTVHHLPRSGVYAVLDTDLAQDVLARPREFSTRLWRESLDFSLLGAEPEEHGAVRRLVTPLLSPRAVQPLAGHVRAVSEEILRAHAGGRELDVVSTLAVPVIHRAIARLLELDEEEVLRCGRAMTASDDPALRRAEAAYGGLRSPAGIRDRIALEDPALSSLIHLLWFAGTVTTVRHLAWSVLELGRRPELRAAVVGDAARLDDFLDEMLRVHPPEPFVERIATGKVRIGGVTIAEGAEVAVAIGLANRDPARYPEPERIVLDRRPKGLLTFGAGPHKCPGSRLGRVLAAPAIEALLDVMPGFALLEPDHVLRVSTDRFAHGLTRLTIAPVG